jgi:hypothetical protein
MLIPQLVVNISGGICYEHVMERFGSILVINRVYKTKLIIQYNTIISKGKILLAKKRGNVCEFALFLLISLIAFFWNVKIRF